MKTNTICCPLLTKRFSKKVISNLLKVSLLLFFFLGIFSNSAFAQNSCLISGDAAVAPYPPAIIKVNLTAANNVSNATNTNYLKYRATSSVPSTYLWTISNNTSGATIFETKSQTVVINPGSQVGSFTLTCKVIKLADTQSINTCTVSVAVVSSP